MAEMERHRGQNNSTESELKASMEPLERNVINVDAMDTKLVGMKLRGQVSEVAFERQSALLRAERTHHNDELERQRTVLATLANSRAAMYSLEKLRDNIVDKLESATQEDKRWVLQALGTRITAKDDTLEISIGVPEVNSIWKAVFTTARA